MGENMAAIKRDFLPADFVSELDALRFDGSVAVQARQSLEETNWLLKLADENAHIKGVVGWVDLCSPRAEEQLADFAKHPKAVGVRHVIQDEADDNFILRPDFLRGVNVLAQFGLTYDILIFPKHLSKTIKFVEQSSPDQTFVLDHIAKPFIKSRIFSPWEKDIRSLAQHPNVYCKLSGMVNEADWLTWKPEDFTQYLDVVFDAFGAQRLMIGSDWPVCLVAGSYMRVLQIVLDYILDFSETDKVCVLGGNAISAYGIQ